MIRTGMAEEYTKRDVCVHVQGFLCFGCLLLGAVADDGVPLGQVQVECKERAVLHA